MIHRVILIAILGLLTGCSTDVSQASNDRDTPLTVEQWKEMDLLSKYTPSTFDRIRAANPNLKHPRAWDRFMVQVVVPERKKDLPLDLP